MWFKTIKKTIVGGLAIFIGMVLGLGALVGSEAGVDKGIYLISGVVAGLFIVKTLYHAIKSERDTEGS